MCLRKEMHAKSKGKKNFSISASASAVKAGCQLRKHGHIKIARSQNRISTIRAKARCQSIRRESDIFFFPRDVARIDGAHEPKQKVKKPDAGTSI